LEPEVASASRGAQLHFSFTAPDGQVFESASTRGRVTVVLLIASFDMASNLMAREGNELLHTIKPRINVGAVLVEAPQYAQLKTTFQDSLGLDYPVVMADHATLQGRGPFGELVHIPTTLILDRHGRETARILGPATREQLSEAIEDAAD
jgi:hypothetical protein